MTVCRLFSPLLFILLSTTPAAGQTAPDDFTVEVVHPQPGKKSLGFAFLPDERILVIGHQTGEVRLLVGGEMREDPVATIPDLVIGSERGLLGIAIDPDWPDSAYVYLFYTSNTGTNRVSKFRVDGALDDPVSDDLAIDLASEDILLSFPDTYNHHNAGTLRFGNDGTLYVSHGDDLTHMDGQEPYLQDLTNPYGKILRIRRDGTAPDDNPAFPESPEGRLPEIFAIGLRNPFRFSIDPLTDRLFIGDVGTNLREEFNLSEGGENFGFPRYEGTGFFRENQRLIAPEPTPPVYDYAYSRTSARSAIALATYRPKLFPEDASFPPAFDGVHFHADYFDSRLRYLRPDGSGGWESVVFGTGFGRLTDGAIASDGSLYAITYDGPLYRIAYRPHVAVERPGGGSTFALEPNYPNPFTDRTTIAYRLDEPAHVRLEVYDVLGRLVAAPVDARKLPGVHTVRFDASGLAPGTYVYRLRAGASTAAGTMVRAGR